MFSPGPSTMFTPRVAASSPRHSPSFSPSDVSQLFAIVAAVGKQVAGREALSPR